MATHNIKITTSEFIPAELTVNPGDKVMFKLHQRQETAYVTVSPAGLFDGDNPFTVDENGKEKLLAAGAGGPYNLTANGSNGLAGDQIGGKIIVTP